MGIGKDLYIKRSFTINWKGPFCI